MCVCVTAIRTCVFGPTWVVVLRSTNCSRLAALPCSWGASLCLQRTNGADCAEKDAACRLWLSVRTCESRFGCLARGLAVGSSCIGMLALDVQHQAWHRSSWHAIYRRKCCNFRERADYCRSDVGLLMEFILPVVRPMKCHPCHL